MNNNPAPDEKLNAMPSTNDNNTHKFDNEFLNTIDSKNQTNNNEPLVVIPVIPNQNNDSSNNQIDDINSIIKPTENRFINDNFDTTSSSLNNLNIGNNNVDGPKIDYSKDPKVMENLQKRNTININSESKVFIIIIIVLLLFIFVLPTVFEFVRNIQYR